jgi:hypothetical protein
VWRSAAAAAGCEALAQLDELQGSLAGKPRNELVASPLRCSAPVSEQR